MDKLRKKLKINNIVLYFSGQIFMSLGVVLAVKADYGITVATSVAYVLSRYFTTVSFGTFNYIVQGIVFLLMLLILKEIKLRYVFSFGTAVLFGLWVDLFTFILKNRLLSAYFQRSIVFLLSILCICMAIAFYLKSNLPLMPFDIFVKKVSEKYSITFGRLKVGFDVANLIIAAILSFIFFSRLTGIHFGTLVLAVIIGPGVQMCLKYLDRFIFNSVND